MIMKDAYVYVYERCLDLIMKDDLILVIKDDWTFDLTLV